MGATLGDESRATKADLHIIPISFVQLDLNV